jgi:DNA polymerase-4
VRTTHRTRRILHVDLAPFFVAVERSLDPALRERPVVVGGASGSDGIVAAASDDARARGVRPGQALGRARELCPEAVFRPGDFETYARISDEVTTVLLGASRRVERPSADEAYVDLTPSGGGPAAVPAAETIKDALQRRLGLDASLGLASSRLAARVASRGARPRGLLVLLPGYEASFLARHKLDALEDLTPRQALALGQAGIETLGQLVSADEEAVCAALGRAAATRLRALARGEDDVPVERTAPPAWVLEEQTLRSPHNDRDALRALVEGLAARAVRRLRPFGLGAHSVSVEVKRRLASDRRHAQLPFPLAGERDAAECVARLAAPLLEAPGAVRSLHVRLGSLSHPDVQGTLFPQRPAG